MGNNIVIDKTTFSASVKNQLLSNEIKNLIAQKHWSLTSGKYKKLRMKEVFMFMRGCQVQSIHLWQRNNAKILNDFCHINFSRLKILILQSNQISSIQALSWAVIPNIEGVSLNSNKISSIKSLHKWNSNSLKSVSLKLNRISQFSMCSAKIGKHIQSTELMLDDSNDMISHPILINDISCLVKTNIDQLVHLSIGNNKRISQYKVQKILMRKWDQLAIIINLSR